MAVLRWDLFDGTRREFERKKAHYQATEAGEQVNGLKQMVSFKIQEAFLTVEESRKHIELARAALETAEEGQRLVKGRFDNSLAPLTDLLSVQLNLDQARPIWCAGKMNTGWPSSASGTKAEPFWPT